MTKARDISKLSAVEVNATADQTDAEVKAAVEAASDSNTFTDADHSKLNAIEASADVTDATNVTAAGALMDSELTNLAAVKAINQSLVTTASPTFSAVTTTGNVGIGTSSPNSAADLHVADTSDARIWLEATSGDTMELYAGTNVSLFNRSNNALTFGTNNAERMRIDSSGNLGIGTTNGDVTNDGTAARTYVGIIGTGNRGRLNIGSTASNGADAGTLAFTNGANTLADINVDTTAGVQNTGTMYINGTRSIKIQAAASDEVVFNESGTDVDFRVESNVNAGTMFIEGSSGVVNFGRASSSINTNGAYILGGEIIASMPASTNTYLLRNTATASYTFYVSSAGQISAVQTSISSLSDERLKENIVDIDTGLDEVMALKPRKFDWKEGEGSSEKNVSGFVAQEVETVLPNLIGSFKHDDLDDAKSVKMGDMVPTLVKAIQEQQELIKSLEDRIASLEP